MPEATARHVINGPIRSRQQSPFKAAGIFMVTVFMATIAAAQAPPPAAPPSQAQTPVRGNQSKVLKDPAEYYAYLTALNTVDPVQKAARMEDFVTRYPQSIIKIDALEQAMAAYHQAGNDAKVEDTSNRILTLDSSNLRALAALTFLKRAEATTGLVPSKDKARAGNVAALGERGLKALSEWEKPSGPFNHDLQKQHEVMTAIFAGGVAFGALEAKDYSKARTFYEKALQSNPGYIPDLFQLARSDLAMNPVDVDGLWYCAKAEQLAESQKDPAETESISSYCKRQYSKHTGQNKGWEQIIAAVANGPAPPVDFQEKLRAAAPIAANPMTPSAPPDSQENTDAKSSPKTDEKASDLLSTVLAPIASGIGSGPAANTNRVYPLSRAVGTGPLALHVGNGVSAPVIISAPDPEYPKSGADAKKEGLVVLTIVIGADGLVHNASVVKTLSPDFDAKAIAAVKNWKFKPAQKDGQNVAVEVRVEVTFKLYDSP